jgi:hypothetical protein
MIQFSFVTHWLLMAALALSVGSATSQTTEHFVNDQLDSDHRRDLAIVGEAHSPAVGTVLHPSSACVTDEIGLIAALQSLSSGTNSYIINVCAKTIFFLMKSQYKVTLLLGVRTSRSGLSTTSDVPFHRRSDAFSMETKVTEFLLASISMLRSQDLISITDMQGVIVVTIIVMTI